MVGGTLGVRWRHHCRCCRSQCPGCWPWWQSCRSRCCQTRRWADCCPHTAWWHCSHSHCRRSQGSPCKIVFTTSRNLNPSQVKDQFPHIQTISTSCIHKTCWVCTCYCRFHPCCCSQFRPYCHCRCHCHCHWGHYRCHWERCPPLTAPSLPYPLASAPAATCHIATTGRLDTQAPMKRQLPAPLPRLDRIAVSQEAHRFVSSLSSELCERLG